MTYETRHLSNTRYFGKKNPDTGLNHYHYKKFTKIKIQNEDHKKYFEDNLIYKVMCVRIDREEAYFYEDDYDERYTTYDRKPINCYGNRTRLEHKFFETYHK